MPTPKLQTKQGKRIDKFLKQVGSQLQDGDVVLPLLGPSGCGKTTFIERLLRPQGSVDPEKAPLPTEDCKLVVVESGPFRRNSDYRKLPGRLLVIDTPGFTSNHASDEKVAQDVSACLQSLYSQRNVWVAGAILMASIEPNLTPPTIRSDSLKALTAEPTAPPTALVTTHWDKSNDRQAGSRTEGVLQRSTYASDNRNPLVFRYYNDSESAWKAVDAVVSRFVLGIEGADRPRPMKRVPGSSTGGESQGRSIGIIGRLLRFFAALLHRQKR